MSASHYIYLPLGCDFPEDDVPRSSSGTGLAYEDELADSTPAYQVQLAKITINPSEKILLSSQQQPHPRGDDRERITRARQAAEALFTSKPPVSGPSVPASPSADQSARKSRVLAISPAVPVRRDELKTPVSSEPRTTREIRR